jgi:hypothetical protein
MSTPFLHSPADIIRQLLILKGTGADPDSANPVWPVYQSMEPSVPDNCITVYNTAPKSDGRSMIDGEDMHHYGMQIRVRGVDEPTAYVKAEAMHIAMTEKSYADKVTVDTITYVVHCLADNTVLNVGKDAPNSKRHLYTINCTAAIRVLGDS